jgi:hypothetical protein
MEQSQSIANLTKALLLFQIKIDTIKFDQTNPFFKSKYASLTHILETIKDPLTECGLVISQFPTDNNGLVTMLIHAESGEYIRTTYYMQPEKNTPQAHGSVVTYQRRYCVQSILNLCFDEDDDANAASRTDNNTSFNKPKPKLTTDSDVYKAAIEKLRQGTTTMEKIKMYYDIPKSVEKMMVLQTTNLVTSKTNNDEQDAK